ncbi:MAG TPA: uracil-DNA glycosylase, partial [Terriglobales bacterium]
MKSLTPDLKKNLIDRLSYYRDLGIYDLYRRPVELAGELEQEISGAGNQAPEIARLAVIDEAASKDRTLAMAAIREDLGDCTRCRLHKQGRKQIVFGVGNPHADLMFVGEAPGADEDEQGIPFVGRAGQLLTNMIKAMGLGREDVYIANVIKCRPPGNRTPEREECETCSPFLFRQIDVVRPKIIVALGAVAAKSLLQINDSMANLRGRTYDFRNTKLIVTYHPAYLLRDPRQKKEAWKDLQKVMQ